jgi:TonB family protein
MSDVWKRWEGQVADQKYHLQRYLDSTDHSAVFLAEFHDPEPHQAAVKFISADVANAEQQLAAWNKAAELEHSNLIRIYGSGRCKIEDMELLYVAMECAEENLAQILPQRALTAEETRIMLDGVVDVLVYLHDKNLTHGHVKPSNILAIGELLKLSSDTILPAGAIPEMRRERSGYDAPEIPGSPYTAAADVWSLGATVVEAMTQQQPVLPFNEQADPVIPPTVPEPFLKIAKQTLRRDPKLRWSSAQVAERLSPAAAPTKAAAVSASANASAAPASAAAAVATQAPPPVLPVPGLPVNVPLSQEPAVPQSKLPSLPAVQPPVARPAARSVLRAPRETIALPSYVVPLFAAAFIVIALIVLPKILRHREESAASTVASSASTDSSNASTNQPSASASRADARAKQPPPAKAPRNIAPDLEAKSSAPEHSSSSAGRPPSAAPAAAPAVLHGGENAPVSTPKTSRSSPGRGEALDQVLPQASGKALATIHGTVRVGVKVHVDAAGNVAGATLANSGPSRYFADLSLKAVRGWVFSPPEADGRSVPSDWLIQFYFTQSGAKAVPQQVTP